MFCALSSICLICVGLIGDCACATESDAAAAMNAKDPMTLDSIGESASYRPSPHLYGVEVGRATVQRPHRAATQHERHSLLSHERSLQFVKVSLQRSDDRSDVVPVGPTRLRTTDFSNRHANIARPILTPKPKRLDFCIERRLLHGRQLGFWCDHQVAISGRIRRKHREAYVRSLCWRYLPVRRAAYPVAGFDITVHGPQVRVLRITGPRGAGLRGCNESNKRAKICRGPTAACFLRGLSFRQQLCATPAVEFLQVQPGSQARCEPSLPGDCFLLELRESRLEAHPGSADTPCPCQP